MRYLNLLRSRRGILGIMGAVFALALAGGTVAYATGTTPEKLTEDREEAAYTSSVTVPDGPETNNEATEAQSLQKLAKIDQAAAQAAALKAVPGTAKSTRLENENGSVVYEVVVTGNDGKTYEVKVDAGNGNVLHRESEGNEGPEAADD